MIELIESEDNISEIEEIHPLPRREKCRKRKNSCNGLYEDNELLTEFIEKCLNMEQSHGMLRVINKNLLKSYKETNKKFKESQELRRVLSHAIISLKMQPNLKFNHVKNLCEVFKSNKEKKRAQLTTLATNLKGKGQRCSQTTNQNFSEPAKKREKVDIIIDLDSEQEAVIDLDDYSEDEPVEIHEENQKHLGHENNNENKFLEPQLEIVPRIVSVVGNANINENKVYNYTEVKPVQTQEEKEKHLGHKNNNENKFLETQVEVEPRIEFAVANVNNEKNKILGTQLEFELRVESVAGNENNEFELSGESVVGIENNEENKCLEPQFKLYEFKKSLVSLSDLVDDPPTAAINTKVQALKPTISYDDEKIKAIIKSIEHCKNSIAILEEAEVTDDTMNSPYIRCEKLKAEIVMLYKELCILTGQQAVKRREVRLQVVEGHPPGPVRRLEQFINDNIGSNGNPPFPDFCDVVKCVIQANEDDGLGWGKSNILKEASALFTQCGRALQKRRQQRDWRDLVSLVEGETCGVDPADEDPQLLARLEQNRLIAAKKEDEILERYTMLQNKPKACLSPAINSIDGAIINESDNLDSETIENEVENDVKNNVSSETENNNIPKTEINNSISENIDVNLKSDVKVKKEPLDIAALLEELGDNYTVSVEIEDPFVVIEISSDSSDGED